MIVVIVVISLFFLVVFVKVNDDFVKFLVGVIVLVIIGKVILDNNCNN